MIIHEYLVHFRHEELLKESERARMISQVSRKLLRNKKFYAPILNRLGNQLCSWGSFLQAHFGDQEILNSTQSMDGGLPAG